MVLLLAALFFAPSDVQPPSLKPQALFDACVTDHERLKAFTVHIDVLTTVPGKKVQKQYDFAVDGPNALLRIRETATSRTDRSDRSFLVRGDRLIAYDAIAGERLQRPLKVKGPILERLASQLGPPSDALSLALSPIVMRKFFAEFRGFRDWREAQSNGEWTLGRSSKGTITMFKFQGAHPLLSEVWIKLKDSSLHWTFAFHSGAAIALHIPEDARPVSAFTVREAPPKFASKQAQEVVDLMERAYRSLSKGTIQISADDGDSTLVLAGKRLREDHKGFGWAYDGSVLSIVNRRTGKFYRGKAIRVILAEYISRAGGEVDPLIKSLVAHRVPYFDLFPTGAVVNWRGAASVGGTKADIIEVKTSKLDVSLFVRRDNHLLASMDSETTDRPGRVQTRSQRTFTYSNLGATAAPSEFHLSLGNSKSLPLPKVDQPGVK